MEWQTFFYCITCSCRREAQCVAEVRTPFCLGVLEYLMFAPVVEETTQVVTPFPKRFRFSSCYCSALAAIGPLNWSLNVVMAMNCRWQRWSIDARECRLPWDIFNYSNPGYVERSWRCNDLVQLEFLVIVTDDMGAGLKFFFSLRNLGNLLI